MNTNQNQMRPASKRRRLPYLLLTLLISLCPLTSSAQNSDQEIFLEIDGITGSSLNSDFVGSIEVLSMGYSAVANLNPASGHPSGATFAGSHVSEIFFTFLMDPKAYPILFMKMITGDVIDSGFKVTGTGVGPDGSRKEYELEIKGRFQSIAQEASAGARSVVNMSVRPTEIKITTFIYDQDGTLEGQAVYTWEENP